MFTSCCGCGSKKNNSENSDSSASDSDKNIEVSNKTQDIGGCTRVRLKDDQDTELDENINKIDLIINSKLVNENSGNNSVNCTQNVPKDEGDGDGGDGVNDNNTVLDKIIEEQPKSCMSRKNSSRQSFINRQQYSVTYNETNEYILPKVEDLTVIDNLNVILDDDDEVFSDSVSPKLPRGDMCTPYPKKRGSIPGVIALPDWFPDDREIGGILEPPVTPIGRDELALKRHRFFSELLTAAQAAIAHRVRFDPWGPDFVAKDDDTDCDPDFKPSVTAELTHLITRLEKIVDRLERSVSAKELEYTNRTFRSVIERTNSEEIDNLPLPSLPSTPNLNVYQHEQQLLKLNDLQQQKQLITITNTNTTTTISTATTFNNTNINNSNLEDIFDDFDNIPTVISCIGQEEYYLIHQEQEEANFKPPIAMSVNGYQDIVNGPFSEYLTLSKKIGGDVAKHSDMVKKAFDAQFKYVTLASASAQPPESKQMELLKPTSDQISAIQDFREKNRASPYFNHLSAISDSIPALGWVCVTPTPGPHVKEMNDAGQFYTNRVLKDWKEKDSTHVEWVRSWVQTLTELQKYIKQYHTTGLVWSGKSVVSGGCVPPPPPGMPPPPPVLPQLGDLSLNSSDDDRSALFAQINQGEDITKSLKKVTSDMQTHKNKTLRTGPAPFIAPKPIVSSPVKAPVAVQAAKPPVFSRDGKKWLIEYQKNNPSLVVDNVEMNNVIYMFKCESSTLTVKGKVNSIFLDSCKKCSVVFDSVVSSVEFVNCQSVQMQVLTNVPTISIDKTDGCQMYLSDQSLGVEIISSKSSEMNVLIPKGNGDFTEQPIPEQYKTTIKGKSLSTVCVESLG